MKKRGTIVCMLFVGLLTSIPATALMLQFSMDEMVTQSTSVVKGRVVNMESYWLAGEGSIIVTDVEFTVEEVWMGTGRSPGDRLVLQVAGGTVGPMGMEQEHAPRFQMQEEAVLFLGKLPDGSLGIINEEQGKYRVEGQSVIGHRQELHSVAGLRAAIDEAKNKQGRR